MSKKYTNVIYAIDRVYLEENFYTLLELKQYVDYLENLNTLNKRAMNVSVEIP